MSCSICGGDIIGDGYTSVQHCENANEQDYEYAAPDEGPFCCKKKPTVIVIGGSTAGLAMSDLVAVSKSLQFAEVVFMSRDELAIKYPPQLPTTLYAGHHSQLPPIPDMSMFAIKEPNYGKQKCWCGSRRKMSQCHPNGPKSGR